jgi:hypothetical protein
MALLKTQLKASTLIEALVAMVIVMICFGIASMIYVNVLNADNNRIQLKAHLIVSDLAQKAKTTSTFLDEKIETEGLVIQKSIEGYHDIPNLSVLKFVAFDKKGKVITEYKELFIIP